MMRALIVSMLIGFAAATQAGAVQVGAAQAGAARRDDGVFLRQLGAGAQASGKASEKTLSAQAQALRPEADYQQQVVTDAQISPFGRANAAITGQFGAENALTGEGRAVEAPMAKTGQNPFQSAPPRKAAALDKENAAPARAKKKKSSKKALPLSATPQAKAERELLEREEKGK